jgi:multimeric flavodoxin WrbA
MNSSTKPCLIAVIVAGMNEPSNSNTLADAFIEGCKTVPGVTFEKIRLRELSLSHFTVACYDDTHNPEPDYLRIKTLLEDASGVIFATPIWNFSVPAHLKNLIDRMGAFGLDKETHSKGQFNGKPFGIIFTGGAPMIAWKALMYLTTLHIAEAVKYYGGTVILRHFEPKCVPGKGKFGLVVNKCPNSLELMKRYGEKFTTSAQQFAATGNLSTGQRLNHKWFELLYRIGNRIMYPISKRQ